MVLYRFALVLISVVIVFHAARAQDNASPDPLVRVLVTKGVLTDAEAKSITASATPAEQRDRLAVLLRDKGVISAAEFEAVRGSASAPAAQTITADYKVSSPNTSAALPQPTPSKVIPAVAPTRLLGIDAPKREGLIPDIKLGSGARLKPYGFFKASIIHDSSSPQGNDFPLPLFGSDTGPTS